jgi:hypothetical protein
MSKIYSLDDLLAQSFTNIATLGIDNINDSIQAHLDWLNASINEQMTLLAERTTDQRRIWGGSERMEMNEVDEFGVARTQAPTSGLELGFPLRKFEVSTGWTNDYLQRATGKEIAKKLLGVQTAYAQRIQDELLFSIFNNVNYTYVDTFVDKTSLAVKAFLNADGAAIPDAPNGTTFDGSTHTHYKGRAGGSLAYTDIDSLISNVVEHGNMKGVSLFVPEAMVATLSGLTSTKFVKLTSAVLVPANTSDATIVRDNVDNDPANKLVGYWDSYPVYTRSWVPANYIAVLATGASEKPLVYREDKYVQGLVGDMEYGNPVITAKAFKAYMGVSVWNRAAGAVLYTGGTSYVKPTLTR